MFALHDGLPDVGLDVLDAAQEGKGLDVQMFGPENYSKEKNFKCGKTHNLVITNVQMFWLRKVS